MRPPLLRLRLLSQTLERERAFIVPVAIAVFLGTLLTVFNPLLHREVIDRVVERDPKVLAVLVVMFGVQAVAVANSHTLSLLVARFNYSAVETLRLCAFDSTICGKVFGEQVTSAGEAYTVIMTDTDRIASFLRQTLPGLLGSLVTFLGTIVGMTYLDPGLLPWAILPVPVQFFVYRYRGQIGEKLSRRSRELSGTLNNVTQELLNSRLEIKTAQGERWAIDRFGGTLREALTQYVDAQFDWR